MKAIFLILGIVFLLVGIGMIGISLPFLSDFADMIFHFDPLGISVFSLGSILLYVALIYVVIRTGGIMRWGALILLLYCLIAIVSFLGIFYLAIGSFFPYVVIITGILTVISSFHE